METVSIEGVPVEVRELSRPSSAMCRLLEEVPGGELILEYVVSTGPYKIDIIHYHRLTPDEARTFRTGTLDLKRLARELEERHWT